jgi:phage gp36-like protein
MAGEGTGIKSTIITLYGGGNPMSGEGTGTRVVIITFCNNTDVLTNLNMSVTEIPSGLLVKSIIKADAEVRAAFSSDLLAALDALETIPAIVKSLAEDIASYFVMRGLYSGNTPSINVWIEKYKEAKDTLKKIAEGTLQIEGITVDVGAVQSSTKDYKRTFDERDETNWKTDPDKLEDLADG